jgi:hypothetical protein
MKKIVLFTLVLSCFASEIEAQRKVSIAFNSRSIPNKKEGVSMFVDIRLDSANTDAALTVDYLINTKTDGSGTDVSASEFEGYNSPSAIAFNLGDTVKRVSFRPILDGITEGNDTFYFIINSVNTPHNKAMPNFTRIIVTDSSGTPPPVSGRPTASIGTIRGSGTIPALKDSFRVVRGVIYGKNSRTNVYRNLSVCDGTGCIGIFSTKLYGGYMPVGGDSIYLSAKVAHFNGLGQMELGAAGDTIYKIASVSPKAAITVTVLDEISESKLVRLQNLTLTGTNPVWTSGSFSLSMNDGSKTHTIRIVNDTNRISASNLILTGKKYSVTGLGSQFDNATPPIAGYQLVPRTSADIVEEAGGSIIGGKNGLTMEIYPNPTSEFAIVSYNASKFESVKLSITDLTGKVIFSESYKAKIGENQFKIDHLTSLPSGNYYVTIGNGDTDLSQKLSIAH